MKFEKINENQIRCILTQRDLSNRKIKLNELSYGSEKARNLFYDMMQQASVQFGFESNGVPLMIEAIPTANTLILNITKVNDPEELETRFSSFSVPPAATMTEVHISGADGILNLLNKIREITTAAAESSKSRSGGRGAVRSSGQPAKNLIEAFRFATLDNAINAAKAADDGSEYVNSLYKYDGIYLLVIHSESADPEGFNRICNVLSEYGGTERVTAAAEKHLREHGYLMIADDAISKLSML